ncbi:hypothetical protein IW146_004439 [Coemansia sp. RSA 922]|nr:hypothetical protein IW146_004439 [Coemansia sp. RSA 922]
MARKIAFVLAMNAYDYVARNIGIDPLTAKANVCAFVERIKQMVPLVDEIRVQPVNCDDMPSMPDQQFGDLACRLYQLGYRIKYHCLSYDADPIWLQQGVVCNLSHISYLSASDVDSVNQFIQLARKNALTLQSLNIECEYNLGVLGIVQDDDGKHVVYPRLLTLKLRLWSKSEEWRRPEFYGAAPFPILRRLHLNLNSAFDDDTFFRGNAATLEWLELQLGRLGASMLRKYKVFVPGSHPRLRRLKIGFTTDFGSVFTSPAEIQQFVCSIGSGAAMREYGRTPYLANPATTFSLLGKYECIQVLSLPNLYLELWHAISLIQSLPLLSDLQTSLPSLGPMRNDVDLDHLPEHIVSNYAPMGRRFRCWHLDRGHFNNYSGTTTCVLLLALACPNFDYATPPSSQRELFMEMMEKDISSDLFKPYAPRLRRLLFNGWNGKQN